MPNAEGVLIARHPSQLYEAGSRGSGAVPGDSGGSQPSRGRAWRPPGLFLLVYGCARFTVEWVRLPDANIGYLAGDWLTMGMLLTMPMILAGAAMMIYAYRRDRPSGNLSAVKA